MQTSDKSNNKNRLSYKLSIMDIKRLGFDWPRFKLIDEYCITEDGKIDLVKILEKLGSSRTYYKKQIKDAFAFKMQTGADYSDFSDHFDDDVRIEAQLGQSITFIEEIIGEIGRLQEP